jgi:uncharacterized membrane protein YphA (DoxX/SURF4 family)
MKKTWIIDIIAILLMVLFLYTGISKVMDYNVFKEQLAESPVLSPVAGIIAIGLPLAEVVVSILLLLPAKRLIGFYSSSILMTAFTLYVIIVLGFSKQLPCSCGGIMAELSWTQHLIVNIIFTAIAVLGTFMERKMRPSVGDRKQTYPLNTSI